MWPGPWPIPSGSRSWNGSRRRPGELACKTLVQEFSISQATISHHLKELSEAGLIECRREAQSAFFSLRRDVMEAYRRELGRRMALDS